MSISTKDKMLDISQNLARIGNWTADSYELKKTLIEKFVIQTQKEIDSLSKDELNDELKIVFANFKNSFAKLKKESITKKNKEIWAEKALTWANILQHKSSILNINDHREKLEDIKKQSEEPPKKPL